MTRRSLCAFSVLVGLSLSQTGCNRSRDTECRVFVTAINGKLGELDRIMAEGNGSGPAAAGEMRRLGKLYGELAADVGRASFSEPSMKRLQNEYKSMLLQVSGLAARVADSLDASDVAGAAKAQTEIASAVSREDALVEQINQHCRGE